jgi:hypothetical protein
MAQTWWMNPAQLEKYRQLSAQVSSLNEEHGKLMQKLVAKTISQVEVTRLREVIARFNQVHSERKQLEDENPIRWENIKAMQEKK